MKKCIYTISIIIMSVNLSYAQIGINKLKKKVKSEIGNSGNSDNDNKEENAPKAKNKKVTNVNMTEEEKREDAYRNSPARSEIWDFKDIMEGVEEEPGGRYAEKELGKAKTKLDVIKEKDPDYPYIDEFEQRYAEGEQLVKSTLASNKVRDEYMHQLGKREKQLWKLSTEPWRYVELLSDSSNAKFEALVSEVKSSEVFDNSLQEKIDNINKYEEGLLKDEVKNSIMRHNEEAYRKAIMWTAEYRKTEDFEKYLGRDQKVDPEIDYLKRQINWTEKLLSLGVESSELTDYIPKAQARLKEIEAFKASGELAKIQERLAYEYLNSIRLGENPKVESSVTALVNKHFDTEKFGKPIKIVTDGGWTLYKNDLDIPTHKRKTVYIVYKDDEGKCIRYDTEVRREYEGGGSYGNMFLEDAYATTEMLCKNVN